MHPNTLQACAPPPPPPPHHLKNSTHTHTHRHGIVTKQLTGYGMKIKSIKIRLTKIQPFRYSTSVVCQCPLNVINAAALLETRRFRLGRVGGVGGGGGRFSGGSSTIPTRSCVDLQQPETPVQSKRCSESGMQRATRTTTRQPTEQRLQQSSTDKRQDSPGSGSC